MLQKKNIVFNRGHNPRSVPERESSPKRMASIAPQHGGGAADPGASSVFCFFVLQSPSFLVQSKLLFFFFAHSHSLIRCCLLLLTFTFTRLSYGACRWLERGDLQAAGARKTRSSPGPEALITTGAESTADQGPVKLCLAFPFKHQNFGPFGVCLLCCL